MRPIPNKGLFIVVSQWYCLCNCDIVKNVFASIHQPSIQNHQHPTRSKTCGDYSEAKWCQDHLRTAFLQSLRCKRRILLEGFLHYYNYDCESVISVNEFALMQFNILLYNIP
ncbi:hypothetical protein GWI33_014915 [Rhynchophorus ferrugineus]|uniref:Uncharacterized protein n=1 Tax=Rhynchophorus ferrugineus TaxID=354439 RepID=A0A834I1P2_RHYFE|nr:hypothetical protein GWI33_014915 [Rhynchophorus ferrugineus]